MTVDLFFFEPVLAQRIWGGDYLKTLYGQTDLSTPIGEAWLISALENGQSHIRSQAGEKWTLEAFYQMHPEHFSFGRKEPFPLLVKLIDAKTKLSVQVHPGDEYARDHEKGSGKSECWYIVDAQEDSFLVIGHLASTQAELAENFAHREFETILNRVPVRKHDFVYIPAGVLHAIGDGVKLVEVQQTSDITYRVFDYERRDALGNLRELHLQKAMDVLAIPSPVVEIRNYSDSSGIVHLVKTPYFKVDKWSTTSMIQYHNLRHQTLFFVVLSGEAAINRIHVKMGDAFMTSCLMSNINVYGKVELLVTSIPDGKSR